MADNTLTTFTNFLLEKQGHVYEVFASEAPFLAELSGYDSVAQNVDQASSVRRLTKEIESGRDTFSGKYVKHVLVTAGLPGVGNIKESQTWNVSQVLPTTEVHINLVRTLGSFTVTVDVERDSMNVSMASAVETLVDQTRTALARTENLEMLGDGTGLQVDITDSATSLTTTCGTSANFDVLLPNTVWDILTRSTGADQGQGLRRKIASVVESTRVITWSTTQTASDGGSGNIVHDSTSGIYIPGCWSNGTAGTDSAPGALIAQGLEQALASTGTFETLDKAAAGNVFWQGVDGRAGDTTSIPLSTQMLDGAVRRGRRSGLGKWDFGIGDPAAIDLYKQSLYSSVRYDGQTQTLKSGYSGPVYDGADAPFPIIKEPMAKKFGVRLIDKASFQLYGDNPGPTFLTDDGSMFRRFNRTLAKEADMLDRWQMGVSKCNTIVYLNNLAQAS